MRIFLVLQEIGIIFKHGIHLIAGNFYGSAHSSTPLFFILLYHKIAKKGEKTRNFFSRNGYKLKITIKFDIGVNYEA